MIWYVLIGLFVIAAVVKLLVDSGRLGEGAGGKSGGLPESYPYHKVSTLLTPAERSFYEVLSVILDRRLPGRYVLFAKVRLSDIIEVVPGTKERRSHLNRTNPRHVDFLVCDRQTLAPVLALELDDSSHDRPNRQARDEFVNAALAAARLPIVHIRSQHGYTPADVYDQIAAALAE